MLANLYIVQESKKRSDLLSIRGTTCEKLSSYFGQLEASWLSSLENSVRVVLGGYCLHESDVLSAIRGEWILCLVCVTVKFGIRH